MVRLWRPSTLYLINRRYIQYINTHIKYCHSPWATTVEGEYPDSVFSHSRDLRFSIPTRRELVKEPARNKTTTEIKASQREHLEYHWSTCPLSHTELRSPVVSDSSGILYNKDAILQFLLPDSISALTKADCDEVLGGRVQSLKDVVEVKFEVDGDADAEEKRERACWICPITRKAFGSTVRAVYLVPCGHAFSEEAVREAGADRCLQCDAEYASEDIIPILPIKDDERERLAVRARTLVERGLSHSLKKAGGKKRKKTAKNADDNDSANTEANGRRNAKADGDPKANKSTATPSSASATPAPPDNGIKNPMTAKLTARVLQEEEARQKRRKMVGNNETLQSLFTSGSKLEPAKDSDFMTRGYSIPSTARH